MISSDSFQIHLTYYCSQLFTLPHFSDAAMPVTRVAEWTVCPLARSPGLQCAVSVCVK